MSNLDNKFAAETLLNHAQIEYKELSDTWRDIERKAQGTIAGAGIYLAGIGVAISAINKLEPFLLFTVIVSVALIAISAYKSLSVLSVSTIETIEDTGNVLIDYEACTNDSDINVFLIERIKNWVSANTALHEENDKKSGELKTAHTFLKLAIISTAFTLVCVVILT